jgi:hypothetical protein
MNLLKTLWILLQNLPAVLDLLRRLDEVVKEVQTEKKISDGLKVITKTFEEKDAKALNDLFNTL